MNCGPTRKRMFKTHEGAMRRAQELLLDPENVTRMLRAYQCPYCGAWHLTHKESRRFENGRHSA